MTVAEYKESDFAKRLRWEARRQRAVDILDVFVKLATLAACCKYALSSLFS